MWPFKKAATPTPLPSHVAMIGSFSANRWPAAKEIAALFERHDTADWGSGGSFHLYGVDGTANATGSKNRIDIHLLLSDWPGLGILLNWSKTGGGHDENVFSLGKTDLLLEHVHDDCGCVWSKGLFVPVAAAWTAVQFFLANDGARPTNIEWRTAEQLPEGVFPEP